MLLSGIDIEFESTYVVAIWYTMMKVEYVAICEVEISSNQL